MQSDNKGSNRVMVEYLWPKYICFAYVDPYQSPSRPKEKGKKIVNSLTDQAAIFHSTYN